MAHDEQLCGRIREVLEGQQGITEQNMFGGVCFLHNGNMLCGCDLKHGLSVRVGPDQYEKAMKLKHAKEMDLTGVPLKGLIFVDVDGYRTKRNLVQWLDRGLAFTKTLPPKTKRKRTRKKA